ncbi:ArgE/DapE family deacylase [Amphibacillus sp. Q70]|uniref:ArgE/DapE family deacylase n=1 Tax=Amphibacillus sp. Q70 TaxID=3453416 RepID=UPI003F86FDB4
MNDEKGISVLQDVIRLKTENNHEAVVAEYYQQLLAEYDIDAEIIEYAPGRSNLIAELKGSEPGKILAYSGHMDVVAAGDHEEWTYDPFGAEIVDGKMYGRGTTDMKAGLTAMVLALIDLKESGKDFNGTLRLVASVGEEIGMYGSKQLTDEGYMDDIDALVIGEPSGKDILVTAHKGSVQYEVISHGKAAHSSMPEKGINSLMQMNAFITEADAKFEEAGKSASNEKLGSMLNVFTVIEGGTQINSVPEQTILKANARTIPECDNQVVLDILNTTIDEMNEKVDGRLELNVLQNNMAVERSDQSKLVQSIRKIAGRDIPSIGLGGATDASNFCRVEKEFDLAIFGPGASATAHTVDEYVEVKDYLYFCGLFIDLALDYLQ